MLRIIPLTFVFLLMSACSGGSPNESDIKAALQDDYTSEVQDQLDQMTQMFGEKRAKEAVFSNHQISDLSDLEVMKLDAEDVRELDNGDYLAKVIYTLQRGESNKKYAARLTLTLLEGKWHVINKEFLD